MDSPQGRVVAPGYCANQTLTVVLTMLTRNEILRKLLHLIALIIPFAILYLPRDIAIEVVIPMAATLLAVDLLRKRWNFLQKSFLKVAGKFLRSSEEKGITGSTSYLISGSICLLLFDPYIAYTAMTFMIVGDAAAAIVGMQFGRIRLASGKSLEGTAACVGACMLFWAFFPQTGIYTALAAALLTAGLELLPVERFNDNIFVPVFCGLVLQVFS